MKIEIDKEADAAFIYFKEISSGDVKKTISLNDSLNVDFGTDGKILGIEILKLSKTIPKKGLEN